MSFIMMFVARVFRFVFSRRFLALFILPREEWSLPNFLRVLSHYLMVLLFIGALFYFREEKLYYNFFWTTQEVYQWSYIFLTWLLIPVIVWLLYFIAGKLEEKNPERVTKNASILKKQEVEKEQIDADEVKTIILHEDDYHTFKRGKGGKVPHILRVETASKEEKEAYQEEHPYRSYYSPYAVLKVEYIEENILKQVVRKVKEAGLKKGKP